MTAQHLSHRYCQIAVPRACACRIRCSPPHTFSSYQQFLGPHVVTLREQLNTGPHLDGATRSIRCHTFIGHGPQTMLSHYERCCKLYQFGCSTIGMQLCPSVLPMGIIQCRWTWTHVEAFVAIPPPSNRAPCNNEYVSSVHMGIVGHGEKRVGGWGKIMSSLKGGCVAHRRSSMTGGTLGRRGEGREGGSQGCVTSGASVPSAALLPPSIPTQHCYCSAWWSSGMERGCWQLRCSC